MRRDPWREVPLGEFALLRTFSACYNAIAEQGRARISYSVGKDYGLEFVLTCLPVGRTLSAP